jgi:DNA modification methylase
VREGKNNPIYNAHTYHTKVPHTAIEKYIEHYTIEDEIVLDGFCGTGMTGIASKNIGRNCIQSDLSPIASFISSTLSKNIDIEELKNEIEKTILKFDNYIGWLYETKHEYKNTQQRIDSKDKEGIINFILYSDELECPYCYNRFNFYDVAYDESNYDLKDKFSCPNCKATLRKKDCKLCFEEVNDSLTNDTLQVVKQNVVNINYSVGKKRHEKSPDIDDLKLEAKIRDMQIANWVPIIEIPDGDKTSEPKRLGYIYAHQLFSKRNLIAIATYFDLIKSSKYKNELMFGCTAVLPTLSKLRRFRPDKKGGGPLSGTYYIASLITPPNVVLSIKRNLYSLLSSLNFLNTTNASVFTGVGSVTDLPIKSNSIDYVFTDPPFGHNLMYSELNFIWESWLKVLTNNNDEAIINKTQNKSNFEYEQLMIKAFSEYYRVLKPKRWITVEFHNSKSEIWNLIQNSMNKAGFIVASVAILDKKQGSFNQVVAAGATKSDLVISAYKPSQQFEDNFLKNAGEDLEIDFIHEFLHQQPIRPLLERTEKMLYSKMLSYYIQHGYEVRYDAKAFYQMLRQNFAEEDGYWFNANQINSYMEYKKKMKLEGIDEIKVGDLLMFVTDEKSALVWLHNFLNEPKSFSDIHTAFTQLVNIQGDEVPELKEMLEQNFIAENGLFRRPQSEPEKNIVIEKREKQLLRQFESLLIQAQTEKKKIKTIRKEAVQLGFEQCYKEQRFQDILTLAGKMDKKLLEENAELNEFVEAAEIRLSGLS